MASRLPNVSRCTPFTAVTTETAGGNSRHSSAMSPLNRAPISITTRVSGPSSRLRTMSESPSGVFRLPSAAATAPPSASTASTAVFVVVFPTEPVMATTSAPLALSVALASDVR